MAYRIVQDDGSVQEGARRIANEQITRALDELDDGELDFAEQVHQVRKRCKKLRGLLRLVRPAFGGYGDENRAFRDAARLLSELRDARTLIRTYDVVTAHFDDRIDRRAFAPIRARLTRHANRLREDPETRERMREVRREMETARDRAATWTLDADGFDAIADGVGRTYGRARERMREACSDPDDETMHEWRKRVKYHWYHARLLRNLFPEMMRPQAKVADELSDLLGDHHDLAVLDARLEETKFGTATDVEAFRALLHERKDALTERAVTLGRLTLVERREALLERWGGYWSVGSADAPKPNLLSAGS